MDLFGQLKSMLTGGRVDVRARYEFLQRAISGTMSKFYKARDRETGQIVGVKILDPKRTADFEARFKGLKKPSEGEILCSIDHPRIVKGLHYGTTSEGESFVVMEYLEGAGLNSLIIGRSPLLDGRRVNLLRQAAEALEAVHHAGYIHRDVCPRNFMVTSDAEELTLIDFGLTVPATAHFMQPGNRTGTPNYMAPELVKRKATDKRLDVFAFGVSAYEICTFHLPWERGTTGQIAMTHANQPPIDIRRYRPKMHPILAGAITHCIERDPAVRFESVGDFLRAIETVESEDAD
jgi:serine/threonine-protein kinase